MTLEERKKLKEILDDKFYELEESPLSTADPNWNSRRLQKWRKLLEDLGIEYQGKLMSIIMEDVPDEIRIEDPAGNVLKLTQDQARKILVLGL